MRRSLLVAAACTLVSVQVAFAADMPTKAPIVPVFNWAGFYVGLHLGGGWVKTSGTLVDATPPLAQPIGFTDSGTGGGALGGGQFGYNWQTNAWVFGIEGDFSGARIDSSRTSPSTTGNYPAGSTVTGTARANWLATVTARAGYAASDRSLIYAKGGAAFMNADYGGSAFVPTGILAGTYPVNSVNATRTGWTVGIGFEQVLMAKWSWKIEYDYLNFGTKRYSFFSPTVGGTSIIDLFSDTHVFKLGVNYHL